MRFNIFDEKGQHIGAARNVRIETEPMPSSAHARRDCACFTPQPGLQVVIDGFNPAARLTEVQDR